MVDKFTASCEIDMVYRYAFMAFTRKTFRKFGKSLNVDKEKIDV